MTPEIRCGRHWKILGIKNNEDLKTYIESIFKRNCHQQDVLIGIYQILFPDWELIKTVGGYPEIGRDLFGFLAMRFKTFDRRHHPDAIVNFWERDGFKLNTNLPPWEISFRSCHLQYYTPREREKKRRKKLKIQYKKKTSKSSKRKALYYDTQRRPRNNYRKGDLIC